jgi:hypothetical protein
MKQLFKTALMCAAMVVSCMATSCKDDPKPGEKEFAINFTAEYTGGTVEVTVDGEAVSSGDKFAEGTDVTIKATIADGYTFEGWSGVTLSDGKALEAAFKMPASDITITAAFEEEVVVETWELTFNPAPKGGTVEVTVDGGSVESGAMIEAGVEVRVKASLSAGYSGVTWSGVEVDDAAALETTFSMPDEDVTLMAAFTAIPYTITIAEMTNGSVEVRVNGGEPITSGSQFPIGAEVYVKADAAESYLFEGWDIQGAEVDDTTGEVTFSMPANDITVKATFKIDESNDWVMIGGAKWAKYNVGAPGEFVEKPEEYGMLYQFGKSVGWYGATHIPADGIFYLTMGSNAGWGSGASANNNPYGQGPCPANYTLPTEAQYNALIAAATQSTDPRNGVNGVTMTEGDVSLFFPYAGYDASGQQPTVEPTTAGTVGFYWMNEAVSWNGNPGPPPNGRAVNVSSSFAMQNLNRAGVLSIRCVMTE